MKPFVVIVMSLSISYVVHGQSRCDCVRELHFVIEYIETNVPSFEDNVDSTNQAEYLWFKEQMTKNAQAARNKIECFKTLTYYVEFFKDNHLALYSYSEDVDESDSVSVQNFLSSEAYRLTDTIMLKDEHLRQYPPEDIRGVYQSADERYTIAVVPDQEPYRDYAGVVVESQSKLWKPGQVRLEIKQADDKRWEVFSYRDDHSLSFNYDYPFRNGILGDAWFKTSLDEQVNPVVDAPDSLLFRMINDSVAYLRLPSFRTSQIQPIDSLISQVDEQVKKTPYLIIDVRNNGGGSGVNAMRLLDYYYSEPIPKDQVELYVTEGNIAKYEDQLERAQQDTVNYTAGVRNWFSTTVKRMKAAPLNSYILLSEKDQYIENDQVYETPRKVAILYNKYCASSCELSLFWADPGDKTLLVGENSGGYVGYGEALVTQTPCYGFQFPSTTTRYKHARQYEADGIPPDYQLDYDSDWIEQTVELLIKEGNAK